MAAKERPCLDLNIKLHEVLMSRKVMITPAPPSKTLIHTKTNVTDAINGKIYA